MELLKEDEVHVRQASLDLDPAHLGDLHQLLSPDERQRAARFYFPRDRDRFIAGRGQLRQILGHYLSLDPGTLRFEYSPHGKPALAGDCGGRAFRFNLAHSQGVALYALALRRELGVDVECVRAGLDCEGMTERFFSPREAAVLKGLPPEARLQAFFTCWTRKEAYLKATGKGLTLSLRRFAVSLAPGEPAALLSVDDDPRETARWCLREVAAGPGFVAALVAEGHSWRPRLGRWPSEAGSLGLSP